MKKVNGLESVKVSLNEGKASMKFAPNSTGKYADVRSGIEKNGFVVKDAQMRVRGKLQGSGSDLKLVVTGSGETFHLSTGGNSDLLHKLQQIGDREVVLDATVPTPEKNKVQDNLVVKQIG